VQSFHRAGASGLEFNIQSLEHHPGYVLAIARQLWTRWGYASVEATVSDVSRCDSDTLPVRLVASSRSRPIGIVNLIELNLPTHPHLRPWLAGLYVWPGHRRQGVGTALCASLEKRARRLGFDRLYLYTQEAEPFYRRLGWSTMEASEWEGAAVAIMDKVTAPQV
jgi:GNAT superfamily N-acetyltransferase